MDISYEKVDGNIIKIRKTVPEQVIPEKVIEEDVPYEQLVTQREFLVGERAKRIASYDADIAIFDKQIDDLNTALAECEKQGVTGIVPTPVVAVEPTEG
jgi:hypothetical protein